MMVLLIPFLAFAAVKPDYLSCDLRTQRTVAGQLGGAITDARQAHIAERTDVLQADIRTARQSRRISQTEADTLRDRADRARDSADADTRQQGFLSAAARASYDRDLDAVAAQLCR